MAVKIRLKRMGKIRTPYYRVVVVDSRKKRDGRVIEQIGKYHPKEEPSLIEVTSDRAQYWLGVGAQPSEAVEALLKITGDWQKFKGLPGTEGTLQVKEPKRDKTEIFNEALKEAGSEPQADADHQEEAPPRRPTQAEKPAEDAAPAEEKRRRGACRGGRRGRDEPPRAPPPRPRRRGSRRRRQAGRGLSAMLAEALEHLVRGIVRHPDDVTVARQAAASRLGPRGAGAPRRPRQGHRPRRPHRHRAAHRHRRARRQGRRARRLRRRRPATLRQHAAEHAHEAGGRGRPPRGLPGRQDEDMSSTSEAEVIPRSSWAGSARRTASRARCRSSRAPTSPSGGSPSARCWRSGRRAAPSRTPRTGGADRRRTRWHQSRLLVTFEGFEDRTAAEALRGPVTGAGSIPPTVPEDPEEFYDHQLVGLAAVDHRRRAARARSPT